MRTTFRLPLSLKKEFNDHIRERHSIRSKSQWLSQAITNLVLEDAGYAKVGLGDAREVNDAKDIVTLTDEAKEAVDNALAFIRKQSPMLEGIRAMVLRSAIRHGLKAEQRGHMLIGTGSGSKSNSQVVEK